MDDKRQTGSCKNNLQAIFSGLQGIDSVLKRSYLVNIAEKFFPKRMLIMDETIGLKLIEELKEDTEKFRKEGRSYQLLEAYFHGGICIFGQK